tara:strand:+ start:2270 stop:2620 length:351 start_codon:yes stop_codon:yes gene_type:complete
MWVILREPENWFEGNLKYVVKGWNRRGYKVMVDRGWWMDVPNMMQQNCRALKDCGVEGMVISPAHTEGYVQLDNDIIFVRGTIGGERQDKLNHNNHFKTYGLEIFVRPLEKGMIKV